MSIADEFPALETTDLSPDLQEKLKNITPGDIPKIEVYEMCEVLKSIKKKKKFCFR